MHVKLISNVETVRDMYPRLCYAAAKMSRGILADVSGKDTPEEMGKVLLKCLKLGHTSVFEHTLFTFEIRASRSCFDQLNRYRHASMCMESSRHVDLTEREYIIPQSIRDNKENEAVYRQAIEAIGIAAITLEHNGVPREDVRMLYGMGMEVNEIFSCNLREFMWILKERLCLTAQWEIRGVVSEMKRILGGISSGLKTILDKSGPNCSTCDNVKCERKFKPKNIDYVLVFHTLYSDKARPITYPLPSGMRYWVTLPSDGNPTGTYQTIAVIDASSKEDAFKNFKVAFDYRYVSIDKIAPACDNPLISKETGCLDLTKVSSLIECMTMR